MKLLALGLGRKTNAGALGLILLLVEAESAGEAEGAGAAAAPAPEEGVLANAAAVGAALLPAAAAAAASAAFAFARLGLKGGISAIRVEAPEKRGGCLAAGADALAGAGAAPETGVRARAMRTGETAGETEVDAEVEGTLAVGVRVVVGLLVEEAGMGLRSPWPAISAMSAGMGDLSCGREGSVSSRFASIVRRMIGTRLESLTEFEQTGQLGVLVLPLGCFGQSILLLHQPLPLKRHELTERSLDCRSCWLAISSRNSGGGARHGGGNPRSAGGDGQTRRDGNDGRVLELSGSS